MTNHSRGRSGQRQLWQGVQSLVLLAALINGLANVAAANGSPPLKGRAGRGTDGCGARQVKLLKLHKVGSTTVANLLIDYATRHNLSQCTTSRAMRRPFLQFHKGAGLVMRHRCDVAISHKNSLVVMQSHGEDTWFERVVPGALSIGIFRDPRDRVLSRYFYDMAQAQEKLRRKHPGAPAGTVNRTGLKPLELFGEWLDKNLLEEGHHYTHMTKRRTVEAAIEAARRLDVVGDTDRMTAFVAMAALKLGCRNVSEFAYTSDKVVIGRPTVADLPPELQRRVELGVQQDAEVFAAVQRLQAEREASTPGFSEILAELEAAMKGRGKADCTFSKVHSNKALFNTPDCIVFDPNL